MSSIHGHGFVLLTGQMADDLSVVNAARVSFGKIKTEMSEADKGLIGFLMRERHGTPFEHNSFRFHIKCPIFVAREWFRHRIGSFNEISGRYTELETVGYIPEVDYVRTQVGKPGSYAFDKVSDKLALSARAEIREAYESSFAAYRRMIDLGIAKEVARTVLPVGVFTEFYWTVNARSLMNFLSLRTHETAQREIRDYAEAVEKEFSQLMPVTYEYWIANNKVSP